MLTVQSGEHMRSLHQQLRDAWKLSGLQLADLIVMAKLDCTPSSLSRKLAGEQVLTTQECEAIAQALAVNLVWVPAAIDDKVEGAA